MNHAVEGLFILLLVAGLFYFVRENLKLRKELEKLKEPKK